MRNLALLLSCSLASLAVLGCGSGNSGSPSGSGGGGGITPAIVPSLIGIAPSEAMVGSLADTILAYGSNFKDGAAIEWNGTPLSTTCVDTTTLSLTSCADATGLTASIPASYFATAGSATISISNPKPGGTSSSLTFTIAAAAAGNTWVRTVAGITTPQDIVWDAARGKLYASVGSADPAVPNTIVPIDPVSGATGVPVSAGNNPNLLSISSDGSYLWAGLDGSNTVQRFLLPGLAKDISFPLPLTKAGNPQQAVALQAAPVNPHTVALIAGLWGSSPTGEGVYVYDDATQRSNFVPGFASNLNGPMIDWMQWGADDSTIYGNQYTTIDAGGIATMNVNSSGVSLENYNGGGLNPTITQFDKSSGLLYSYGATFDPVKLTQVGQFNLPTTGAEACTADSSLGRYYCVTTLSLDGTDVIAFELWVFDLHTYALLNRTYFGAGVGGSSSSVTGRPATLRRWGKAGLALITYASTSDGSGGIFLLDGAAVDPNAAPDVTFGASSASYAWLSSLNPQSANTASGEVTVTIKGTGFSPNSTACWNCNFLQFRLLPTTYVSPTQLDVRIPIADVPSTQPLEISVFDEGANLFSSNALTFTILPASAGTQVTPLNVCGLTMAWDQNSQLLYVGTADYDGAYPNSIVAIDGKTSQIVKAQTVAPDPIFLSDSANGEYLYVAYAGATNLTQLALPGLNTTSSAILNNPQSGPWVPGDMKAAPVNPHTVAVTLIKPGWTPEAEGGVTIFDDGEPRPDFLPGWLEGQSVPALYDLLAWSASDQLLTSAPSSGDGAGPFYELQVDPSGVSNVTQGPANFNPYGGELHSDFGTGFIYSDDGSVVDPHTGAIVGNYNASGLLAPDSSLNRVFIFGQTAAQANSNNFTIESFDEKTFTPVSSITLSNLSGSPFQLVRWGSSGLALLTSGGLAGNGFGMLYLVNDASFVSNAQPASAGQAVKQELVKQRWKRLSKSDLRDMLQQRHRGR